MEKTMAVNSDRNPRMEPRRPLSVNTDNFQATPATKPSPNVIPFIYFDLIGTAESARPPYTIAQTCALERSIQFQHQRNAF